jgi:hypothetical protein
MHDFWFDLTDSVFESEVKRAADLLLLLPRRGNFFCDGSIDFIAKLKQKKKKQKLLPLWIGSEREEVVAVGFWRSDRRCGVSTYR